MAVGGSQVHCSATGRDLLPDVDVVRTHLASEKYGRAARVVSADFTAYEVRKLSWLVKLDMFAWSTHLCVRVAAICNPTQIISV
jgi:hypothetical protein